MKICSCAVATVLVAAGLPAANARLTGNRAQQHERELKNGNSGGWGFGGGNFTWGTGGNANGNPGNAFGHNKGDDETAVVENIVSWSSCCGCDSCAHIILLICF